MSAPPLCLVDPPVMPTTMSRLPKFSSRPKSSTSSSSLQSAPALATAAGTLSSSAVASTRLTNGFYHHPGPAGVNGSVNEPASSLKPNGMIRAPSSFSMKWRKDNGTQGESGADTEMERKSEKPGRGGPSHSGNNLSQHYSQRQQELPKNTKSAMKVQSPSLEHSARTLPLPKNGSKVVQTAPKLNNDTKHVANGFSGLRPRSSTDSFLRHTQRFLRPGPGSGSGSRTTSPSQKKTPAGRSHSSDGLGSVSAVRLTEKDRISSRSLTQVQKQPSPVFTVTALPCSIQAPPKGGKKSPVTGQVSGGGLKATGRSGLPPSALKKPLSPALGPASKPSGISYKLSRPMLLKQARPLRVMSATASELNSVKISSPTENSRGMSLFSV